VSLGCRDDAHDLAGFLPLAFTGAFAAFIGGAGILAGAVGELTAEGARVCARGLVDRGSRARSDGAAALRGGESST
jgi:hypothetical protein